MVKCEHTSRGMLWAQASSIRVYIYCGLTLHGPNTQTVAYEANIGSFLCCKGAGGLQEQWASCDIENWVQFVPDSRSTNSNQPKFMQHAVGITFLPRTALFHKKICKWLKPWTLLCSFLALALKQSTKNTNCPQEKLCYLILFLLFSVAVELKKWRCTGW